MSYFAEEMTNFRGEGIRFSHHCIWGDGRPCAGCQPAELLGKSCLLGQWLSPRAGGDAPGQRLWEGEQGTEVWGRPVGWQREFVLGYMGAQNLFC